MNASIEDLFRIRQAFVETVEAWAGEASDRALETAIAMVGDGPLTSPRVRELFQVEVARRKQDVIWLAHWEVNPRYDGDDQWLITNTRTGVERRVAPARTNHDEDRKFAVETVAGYEVEQVGQLQSGVLFRAVKGTR